MNALSAFECVAIQEENSKIRAERDDLLKERAELMKQEPAGRFFIGEMSGLYCAVEKSSKSCDLIPLYAKPIPQVIPEGVEFVRLVNAHQVNKGDILLIVQRNNFPLLTHAEDVIKCNSENDVEIIINKKENKFFNVDRYFNGNSWAKSVFVVKISVSQQS